MTDERKGTWKRRDLGSVIAFIVSFCLHTTLGISLAFVVFGGQGTGRGGYSFSVEDSDGYDDADLTEFEISSADAISGEQANEVSASQVIQAFAKGDTSNSSDPTPSVGLLANARGNSGIASIVGGVDFSKEGGTGKSGSSASFFGTSAHGDRFVFVIDSSGSMRGPRWFALCKELLRAIQTLSPDQEFFIISFDSDAHPMFGAPPPVGKFIKPSRENVVKVRRWITSIELGRQTFPASAMGMALRLKPDAIFLLSDGEINDSTVLDLRLWNRELDDKGYEATKVPIHTFLLHSQVGYFALQSIANENAGTFTAIPEPPGLW